MGELTGYVLDHLQALSGFDVALILLMTALASTASGIGLRRFYQGRFEAQNALLELRESTSRAFKERVGEEEEASKRLRHELQDLKKAADSHQAEASAAQERATGLGGMIEALAETALPTQQSLYQFQRLYLLQRLLYRACTTVQMYFEFLVRSGQSIDPAIALGVKLEEAAREFRSIDDEIVRLALPMPGKFQKGVKLPAAYSVFPYRKVEATMESAIAIALAEMKSRGRANRGESPSPGTPTDV